MYTALFNRLLAILYVTVSVRRFVAMLKFLPLPARMRLMQGRVEKIRAPPQPEIPGPPLRTRLPRALTAVLNICGGAKKPGAPKELVHLEALDTK